MVMCCCLLCDRLEADLLFVWLLVTQGYTAAYTKSGYRINKFSSLLPGGSHKTLKPGGTDRLGFLISK